MNVLISTVESDSQCVLTNHARSAACIMATEVLVLSRSRLPCLHLTLLIISLFCFPHEFSQYHYHGQKIYPHTPILWKELGSMSQYCLGWLTVTTTPCHTVLFTGLSRSLHGATIFHRLGYCSVMSVLLLYIRGSRTVFYPRPRPRGQSHCVLRPAFWLDGLPLPASGSAVQRAMKE